MTKICKWIRNLFADHVVLIAIIWLVIGLGLLCTYWVWDWRVLAGIATWVLAGGVFLAFSQIREARKSTNAQLAVELFKELRSQKTKHTLGLIYRLRPENIERLNERPNTNIGIKNLKDEINSLLDKFEMLGSLVNRGIVDKSLAIEAYGGAPALRCWYCLAGYIREEEKSWRGFFLQNYEDFTRTCLEHFNREQVKIKFYKENSTDEPIDLVQFFKGLQKGDEHYPRSLKGIKRYRTKKDKKVRKGKVPSNTIP